MLVDDFSFRRPLNNVVGMILAVHVGFIISGASKPSVSLYGLTSSDALNIDLANLYSICFDLLPTWHNKHILPAEHRLLKVL